MEFNPWILGLAFLFQRTCALIRGERLWLLDLRDPYLNKVRPELTQSDSSRGPLK